MILRGEGDTEAVEFLLKGGLYSQAIVIDPELAGDGISFRAENLKGNLPCFSAGTRIRDWKITADGLWTATLDQEPAALFVGDKACQRARMPNHDYWRIEKSGLDRRSSFTWQENSIPIVRDQDQLTLVFLHDWSISRIPVKSLDPATRTLTTRSSIGPQADHYKIDHYETHPRFFLEGSRDFLDVPGEWHYQSATKILSYMPRPGEDPGLAIATTRSHSLQLRGTKSKPLKNLRFSGIIFSHANWLPQEAYAAGQASFHEDGQSHTRTPVPCSVEVDFCDKLLFSSCQFTNSSGGGLWIRRQCRDVTVENCSFSNLGANGLMIGEPTVTKTVTRDVTVKNCNINKCGQIYFGAVGIWIGMAADCTLRDNEIHELPYTGISLGWRWNPSPSPCKGHLVENNHIHHILLTLSDGGGIYTLGRQPGTILRDNHIHDVRVNAGRAESNGSFMDEGTTEFLVEGNDIHDISRSPIRFHRAGKNILRNNKLQAKKGIPNLRFNRTSEQDITVD